MRHATPRLAPSADLRRWLVVLCAVLMLVTSISHGFAHAAQHCGPGQATCAPNPSEIDLGDDRDASEEAQVSAEHCCACASALPSDHVRVAHVVTATPVRQGAADPLAPSGAATDSPPPKSLT